MEWLRGLTGEEYRIALIGFVGVLAGGFISVCGVVAQIRATARESRRARLRSQYLDALEIMKRARIAAGRAKSADDNLATVMNGSQTVRREGRIEGEDPWESASRDVLLANDAYIEAVSDCITAVADLSSSAPRRFANVMQLLLSRTEEREHYALLVTLSAAYVRIYAGPTLRDRFVALCRLVTDKRLRQARKVTRRLVKEARESVEE